MSMESMQILIEAMDKASKPIQAIANQIEALQKTEGRMKSLGDSMTGVGQKMSLGVTAPIVGGLGLAAKAAMDFETAMVDTNKAVNASTTQQMAASRASVMRLSKELGTPPVAMAGLIAEAGRLGVASSQTEDYTRMVTQIGSAWSMSTDEAGTSIAKLTNIGGYMNSAGKVDLEGLRRFASTIDLVADSGATSETALANVMRRAGGTTRQFGLTNEAAVGLAGGFLNLGDPPEVVGTAINGMLPKLMNATRQTKKFQEGLASIGIDAKTFEQAIKKDANGAFQELLGTLSKAPNASAAIQDMFGSGSDSAMLAKASQNFEAFKKTMDQAAGNTDASRIGTSFQKATQTSASALSKLKANLDIFAIEIGSALLPAIADVAQAFTPLVEAAANFARNNQGIVKIGIALLGVAAAAGPVLIVVGQIINIFSKLAGALAFVKKLQVAFALFSGGMSVPFLPIIAGAIALGAAAYLIIKNWQPIKEFFVNLFNQIKTAVQPAVDALANFGSGFSKGFMESLTPLGPIFDQIKTSIGSIGQAFTSIGIAISPFVNGLMQIGAAIFKISPLGQLLNAVGQAFQSAAPSASSFGSAVGQAFAGAVAAVGRFIARIASIASTMAQVAAQMVSTIMNVGSRMFSAGAQIVQRLAAGIRSAIGAVTGAISAVTSRIAAALPGSPVQEGVLTRFNNLSSSPGANLMRMLGAGIGSVPIAPYMQSALAGMGSMGAIAPTLSQGFTGSGGVAAPQPGGGSTFSAPINIVVNPPAGSNAGQIADSLEARLRDLMPRLMSDHQAQQRRVSYGAT